MQYASRGVGWDEKQEEKVEDSKRFKRKYYGQFGCAFLDAFFNTQKERC